MQGTCYRYVDSSSTMQRSCSCSWKDSNNIQQYFSSERLPTLWCALPAIEELQTAWENKHDSIRFSIYRDAINDGLEKLKKYYSRFDQKPSYVLALGALPLNLLINLSNIKFQLFTHITSSPTSDWHGAALKNRLQSVKLGTSRRRIGRMRLKKYWKLQ